MCQTGCGIVKATLAVAPGAPVTFTSVNGAIFNGMNKQRLRQKGK